MIVPKLQFNKRTASALNYNEKKVDADVASVFYTHNISNPSKYAIYSTMEKLESNPAIHAKTRNMGFHMAVSPGVDDAITNAEIIPFINELMAGLGYQNQPYVVYKHNDIEREHFHVVSCRIQPNGNVVRDCHDIYAIQRMLKELAPKYNFIPGLPDDRKRCQARTLTSLQPGKLPVMNPEDANKKKLMADILDTAMSFPFISPQQIQAVLSIMGVEMKTIKSPDKKTSNVMLRGLDKNGKPATKWISAQNAKQQAFRTYDNHLKHNILSREKELDQLNRLKTIMQFCYQRCKSLPDLVHLLNSMGIRMMIPRNRKSPSWKNDIIIVDTRSRSVFSFYEMSSMNCYDNLTASFSDKTWMNGQVITKFTNEDKAQIKNTIKSTIRR